MALDVAIDLSNQILFASMAPSSPSRDLHEKIGFGATPREYKLKWSRSREGVEGDMEAKRIWPLKSMPTRWTNLKSLNN